MIRYSGGNLGTRQGTEKLGTRKELGTSKELGTVTL